MLALDPLGAEGRGSIPWPALGSRVRALAGGKAARWGLAAPGEGREEIPAAPSWVFACLSSGGPGFTLWSALGHALSPHKDR